MTKPRNLILWLVIMALAAAGASCRRVPNQKKIDKTLARLDAAQPSVDEQPWRILLHIHGGGLFARLDNPATGSPMDAVAFLAGQAGAQGWSVNRPDKALPMIMSKANGLTVEQHPNMFTGTLLHAGADPVKMYITTATGESPELREFVSSMLVDLDPDTLAADAEYIPGPQGNALGWTLLALADAGLTEASWDMGAAGRMNISRVLPAVLDRPLDWGPTAGLDEHFGLARCVFVHRRAQAKEGADPFGAALAGVWGQAARRLDSVVAAIKKSAEKDGLLDAGWSGAGRGGGAPAERVRHTARALAVLSMAMPEKQLREKWVANMAAALCDLVNKEFDAVSKDPYALAYSAHALRMYRGRLSGEAPRQPKICGMDDCPYANLRP